MKSFRDYGWEQSVGYMKVHLEVLKGLQIYSLLDIGAAQGHFSMMFNNVFDTDIITMVEANPLSCEKLRELPWNTVNKAVGKPGKSTFYINPDEPTGGGSSLYRENTDWFIDANKQMIDVVSLDEIDVNADFVKIDVQGAELDVIANAPKTMAKAKYLLLELSFLEYNKNAPLIDDVLAKTRELGFRMIDTFGPSHGGHWYKGRKAQVDVLLAREPLNMV